MEMTDEIILAFVKDANRMKVAKAHTILFETGSELASIGNALKNVEAEDVAAATDEAYWAMVSEINAFRTQQE
ncbi:MAG TPA: hypothetical protein VHL77_07530 [Ferruginibacter sp.]|jgi:hypothetical protein|nr:hypothetical protein [Ferruginibacter sp.]